MDDLDVIAKLKLGLTAAETAKLAGIAESTVERIRDAAVKKGLLTSQKTHIERAELRRRIATWVGANEATIAEAADHFGVSGPQIAKSCREHGVEPIRSEFTGKKGVSQFAILAMLIDGLKQVDVARHYGVSRNYVNIVADKARKAGVFTAVDRVIERSRNPEITRNGPQASLDRLRDSIQCARTQGPNH